MTTTYPTSGKYFATEPNQAIQIELGQGYAGQEPYTVMESMKRAVAKHGSRPALALKRRAKPSDPLPTEWQIWTYNDYMRDCRHFAKSLIHLGMEMFEVVNIIGFNSPEWMISLVGATFAGCIGSGVYSTNLPEACHYVAEHSKTPLVVLENNKQLAKYAQVADRLPLVKAYVMWEEAPDAALVEKVGKPVYTWNDFLSLGAEISDSVIDERISKVGAGNCASLIYTSGTTGNPKAVMISHDNATWTSQNVADYTLNLDYTDRIVSYLPLSHIAAQLIDIFAMIYLASAVYFCQPDALKGTLTVTMKEVRPTFFFGVPRVYEKIQEKMVEIGRSVTGVKKSLSNWAKAAGLEKNKAAQYGSKLSTPWGYGCANAIVLSKIREALGLDQTKGCFTAAAPISPDVLWYFASLDIPVYEVFGQSECSGPHTVSQPGAWKVGYCGRPIQGSQSRIDSTTGELCYKGRHIFMGYMHMPKETMETIDQDGYLHSGDVAEFDDNDLASVPSPSGFMRITGRIKEILITAGGENIPPVLIENEMKTAMPALSNCMVIGDKMKFLTMLVSLKTVVDPESGRPTDKLAPDSLHFGNEIGSSVTTYSAAKECPLWKAYVDNGMKKANKKTTSNAQIIQKWTWLPVDFSEADGDLTPTLKLKRKVVTEKYAELISSLYPQE